MNRLISGVMIVRNEEVLLPRVIENIRGVVDGIFVMDGVSEDRTIETLKRYGCKYAVHPFDNWRDQRNRAMELFEKNSEAEWALMIDADEMLSPELKTNLVKVITSANKFGIDIIGFCRANYLDGSGPRDWPDVQPRLLRRGTRYSGSTIHEAPMGSRIDIIEKFDDPNRIGYIIHDKTGD